MTFDYFVHTLVLGLPSNEVVYDAMIHDYWQCMCESEFTKESSSKGKFARNLPISIASLAFQSYSHAG